MRCLAYSPHLLSGSCPQVRLPVRHGLLVAAEVVEGVGEVVVVEVVGVGGEGSAEGDAGIVGPA